MKFSKTFISIVAIIVCGFGIFELTRPDYPTARNLTNKEGRTLDALIVGRDENNLFIERLPDKAEFDIPTSTLVMRDKIFAFRLRESARPKKVVKVEKKEDRYIQIRRDEIAELKKQESLFQKELASGTLDESMVRKRQDDLAKLQKEIKSLELGIETYKYQNRK